MHISLYFAFIVYEFDNENNLSGLEGERDTMNKQNSQYLKKIYFTLLF